MLTAFTLLMSYCRHVVLLSNIIVHLHSSVSLKIEKNCCKITEDKIIAFCEKTAGLRIGNFTNLNSEKYLSSCEVKVNDISRNKRP